MQINEIHMYKYKPQNDDVQCKKMTVYFDATQKLKKIHRLILHIKS